MFNIFRCGMPFISYYIEKIVGNFYFSNWPVYYSCRSAKSSEGNIGLPCRLRSTIWWSGSTRPFLGCLMWSGNQESLKCEWITGLMLRWSDYQDNSRRCPVIWLSSLSADRFYVDPDQFINLIWMDLLLAERHLWKFLQDSRFRHFQSGLGFYG